MENMEIFGGGQHQGDARKEGWQTKKLGDLVEVQNGYAFSSKDYSEAGHFLMRIGNVQNGHISTTDPKFIKLPADGSLHRFALSEGDILVSLTGNVGRVGLIQQEHLPAALNQRVARISIRKDSPVTQEFLLLFLFSDLFREELICAGHGTAQQNVSTKDLIEIKIPVPPLPEQQRIVALLDEAFAGLATAKANAERNLQNARAIFESHLQSVFSQRGEGWKEKRLEEVCGLQNGFAFKSSTFKHYGVPILRISNIQDGRIDAANRIVFFDPTDYRENLDRYRIVEGDLLIAMSGATTGKLGFNTESKVYYLNQRVGKFEPTEKLNKRFLYHFLSTKVEENLRISAGTAQPNLSTEQIKGFVLPLPSVDEQERIVDAFETLSEKTQHLSRLYERKLAALEELKKTLLHQAFNGEL
jgi:type I restriction enzyme S subunit